MYRLKILAIVFAAVFVICVSVGGAEDTWKAGIIVEGGGDRSAIYAGTCPACSDGYDALEDANAYFSGSHQVYFYHPEWGRSAIVGASDYFWADMRSQVYPQTWQFYVIDSRVGNNIVISWDLSQLKSLQPAVRLSLTDDSGGPAVEMTEGGSYTYTNTSSTARTFTVTGELVF